MRVLSVGANTGPGIPLVAHREFWHGHLLLPRAGTEERVSVANARGVQWEAEERKHVMNLRHPYSETLVKQCSGFDFSFVDIGDSIKIFPDFALSIVVLMFALFLQNFTL